MRDGERERKRNTQSERWETVTQRGSGKSKRCPERSRWRSYLGVGLRPQPAVMRCPSVSLMGQCQRSSNRESGSSFLLHKHCLMSLRDGDMQEGGLHGHRDMQWASQLALTQGPPWQGPAPTCTGTEDSALETLLGPILCTSSNGCSS